MTVKRSGAILINTATNDTSPISGFSKLATRLNKTLEQSKVRPFRFHDLRRTMVSHMAEMGIPSDVSDKLLNHATPGIKGVYQRYHYIKERRNATVKWSNLVLRLVTSTEAQQT